MSAEVAVKKRGRPKKLLAGVEEIEETPKKSVARKTIKAATPAKKTAPAKKPVKAEAVKSSLPQKPKNSVLEEVKKLEVSKGKTNPTTKSASSGHSSSKPNITSNEPTKSSTTPIKPPFSETSSARVAAKARTNSKILNEAQALSKKAGPADEAEATVQETVGKTTGESSTHSTTESVAVADTPPKEVAVLTTSISSSKQSTMAKTTKEQPLPKPEIPITALNSKVVSDLAARGGARINPAAGAGKLPANYNTVARKITRTIIALPILLVTSYALYERLIQGEEQKKVIRLPQLSGTWQDKKEEGGLKDSKPSSTTS